MMKRHELYDGKGNLISVREEPMTDEEIAALVLNDIRIAEKKQTARRLREAALGDADSIEFLRSIDQEVSALRTKLPRGNK